MIANAAVLLAAYRLGVRHGGSIELSGARQSGETGQPALTGAEREAVRYMIAAGKFGQRDEALTEEHAATLRGLLGRLGGDA